MIFYRMNADWSEVRDVVSIRRVADKPRRVADKRRPARELLEEYVHPDDQERVFEEMARAVQAGRVFELEHRVRGADGRELWAVSRGAPLEDPEGRVIEWFCTVADVTARRNAEEALREKEARHAFLLQLGDQLRELTDADEITLAAATLLGRHLKVNRVAYGQIDAACEYTTVRSEWTDGVVPSARGRYRLADFGPEVLATIRRGEIRRVDDTSMPGGQRSAGDEVLGVRAALGVPMLKGGRLVAVMGVHSTAPRRWTDPEVELVRDVGERIWSSVQRARSEAALRASEAKYRMLFESMDEGFGLLEVLFDEHGTPVDTLHVEANPAFAKHTGLTGVVGKKGSEIFRKADAPRRLAYLKDVYAKVICAGEPLHTELYSPSLDRWLELRMMRVAGPARAQIAVLFTDVSVRRQAAEELSRNAERSAFMVKLADALEPLADPVEIQGAVTRILGQHVGADRVHYAEVDGDKAVVRRDYTSDGAVSSVGEHEIGEYRSFFQAEVASGRTLVLDDIRTDPRLDARERAAQARHGMCARVSVPLLKQGVPRGLLSAQRIEPHAWTLDEVELIEETAERTWAALERARAESALRETEERFRAIVQNVQDYAIFLTDARGVITEWPNGAERMLGYSAGEAVGQPASVFYCQSALAASEYEGELAEAAAAGRAEREGWRVRKDGQRLWVNEIWTAVRDVLGKLVGFTKISRDLTEKRRGEEALRELAEANAYRSELADSLRVVSDPVEIQAAAAALLGRYLGASRVLCAEIVGGTSIVHRDDVQGARSLAGVQHAGYHAFFRQQSEAGLTTAIDDVETDQKLSQEQRARLSALGIGAIVSVPLVKAGELRASFDVHHDKRHSWEVSEILRIEKTAERVWAALEHAQAAALLKESEERFRQALEIETVGVVFFDSSGEITRANDAFCRMTGYTQQDVCARQLSLSMLTPAEVRGDRGRAFEVLEATGSAPACEQLCIRKDGSYFWGLFAAKRLSAAERVEFILDITERKRAEEGLAAAHAELEERVARRTAELAETNRALAEEVAQRRHAEEVRSDLLRRLDSAQEDERRRVARDLHDQVGQTLTALTLAVRATREAGSLPAAVSARLAEVQRTAEELGREVHGLAVRLRPTALDDLGLHAALGQLLSEWSSRTNIEVDCHLSDLEKARLPPDFETMLYRIVQEALTNVARHARAEHASVTVQRVNGSVVAVVEDDGVGFDVNAVSNGRIGLLGLTERVTLAGGALDIESSYGKGTTVIARIPC